MMTMRHGAMAVGDREAGEGPHGERAIEATRRAGRRTLVILFVLFLLPVVASYTAYYLVPPSGRTNYGALIEPQVDLPDLAVRDLDGRPFALSSLRGKWLMVTVDDSACERACADKLWAMRQVRLTTGRDRDRIERVWLVTDAGPVRPALLAEHEGARILRADAAQVAASLPLPAAGARLAEPIWIVDPLGHVMLRFPPNADPNRMKKDITKLLKASRIG